MHARVPCRFPLQDPRQSPTKASEISVDQPLCTRCLAFNHPLYLPRLQKFSKLKNLKNNEGQKQLKKKIHKTTVFYLNSGEEKQNSLLMWKQALSLSVYKTFKIVKTGHQFCGIHTRKIYVYIPFDRACFFC